jgi:endonuclease/exonuclease/phosphatase family metal-dependent hydrolase
VARGSLKIATWNMEWLIAPRDFKALRARCGAGDDDANRAARAIPCDVGYKLERSHADFAALADYARLLDADVVALQETDGPAAARLVFPHAQFCFTRRAHPQNNGFAVRAGLPHRCEPDFTAIAAGDGLRRGAVMTLYPGEPRELTLMSVHLKSGCARAPLDSASRPCRALSAQLPEIARWVAEQRRLGHRFAVLGDFNRQSGLALASLGLSDPSKAAKFENCYPGQMHTGYIDHILLDPALLRLTVPGSFEHLTYRVSHVHRRKLSDHCPLALRLKVDGRAFD